MQTIQAYFVSIIASVMSFVGLSSTPLPTLVTTTPSVVIETSATTNVAVASTSIEMEIINGISVPPEPDEKINNSTLEGVDVNGNGVRDDVEFVLAGTSRKSTYETKTLAIGALYNRLSVEKFTSASELAAVYDRIACLDAGRPSAERRLFSSTQIGQLTANTPARKAMLRSNELLIADLIDGSPAATKCD